MYELIVTHQLYISLFLRFAAGKGDVKRSSK